MMVNLSKNILFIYFVLLPLQFRITAWIPTTIFAIMALLAGLLTILMPETMGRDLPVDVADVAAWPILLRPEEKQRLKDFKLFGKRSVDPIHIDDAPKEDPPEYSEKANGTTTFGATNPAFEGESSTRM